jgi:hypothetical protein
MKIKMISKTKKFIEGYWGKIVLYGITLAFLYTSYACTAYHQVSMEKEDFMVNRQIQSSLGEYTFYVHDGSQVFELQNPQVVNGKDIAGTLVATDYEGPKDKKDWKRQERKEWWKEHRFDIHIYTNSALHEPMASAAVVPSLLNNSRVTLSDDMIQDIKVMGYDTKQGATDAVVAVVVVVGLIVVVWLLLMNVDNDNGGSGGGGGSDGDGDGSGSGGGSGSDVD